MWFKKLCQRYSPDGLLSTRYYDPEIVGEVDTIYISTDFPNVFLGGAHELEEANAMVGGFCSVFDCRGLPEVHEGDFWNKNDYLRAQVMFDQKVAELVDLISSNRCPIFVHCAIGANRSVSVLAAALCELTGKSLNAILGEMRSQRSLVSPQDPYYLMALEHSRGDSDEFKNRAFRELDLSYDNGSGVETDEIFNSSFV